jgi:arginase
MDGGAATTGLCIDILGAPLGDGAGHPGALMGPAAFRIAGLSAALQELGHDTADLGDIVPECLLEPADGDGPGARNLTRIVGWTRAIAARTHDSAARGRIPVVTGGDHSLSMGSVAGVARHMRGIGRPLHVLWLDAHTDFNTPATSPSGNVHGMAAAVLCGEPGLAPVMGDAFGCISPSDLTVFGARSVDRPERMLLRDRGVEVVDMRRIDEHGVGVLMRGFIERAEAVDAAIHVSFDVDFLDPALAPGVGTAVPGGATYREAHLLMEMLHDCGRVSSLDLVELNPFLDDRGRSAIVMVEMAASLFGLRTVERPNPRP